MINLDDEIKQLFLKTSYPKNVRISFPYDDIDDITNENIVAESLEFTENICNQTPLKFGLCEASRLLFDTIDVGNLKGKTIDVAIELEFHEKIYSIPYGRFIVESHKRKTYYNYIRHAECYSLENLLESRNTFYEYFKEVLANIKFKNNVNFYFSAEELVYLAFPTVMSHFELYSEEEYSFFSEKHYEDYTLKYWVRNADYIGPGYTENSIFTIKSNYDPEYVKKVKELVKLVPENSSLNEYFYGYVDTYYVESEGNYRYFDISSLNSTKEIDQLFNPKNFIYPGLVYANLYELNSYAYQTFINISLSFNRIPVRIELYKNDSLLYDTGFYDNRMYIAKLDVDFLKKDENKIFEVSSSRKTIQMSREHITSTGSTTVNRNVYMLNTSKLFEINTYDYLQAYLELKGVFGKIDRLTGSIEEIKMTAEGSTYPSDSISPADDLYMKSKIAQIYDPSMCIDYLFDDEEKKKYKSIICKYKNTSGEETTYEYVIRDMTRKTKSGDPVYDIIDYIDYDVSDNYIIKNNSWTEEQIESMLIPLADALEDFTYTFGTVEAVGLPYIEAGDQIEVLTPDGGYITYILTRTLRGINSLRDTLSSE